MESKADILNELTSFSPLLAAMKKINVFSVPDGYFESIADTVLICLQEENVIPVQQGSNAFGDVPLGYFDNLAGSILNRIKTGDTAKEEISSLSFLLYGLRSKNVFEVPGGYFESTAAQIFNKINTADIELKELSPLLHGVKSKNVFEVPEDYFANFPGEIVLKVKASTAKVVSMPKRKFLRYAIAAMLTGALALGVYKYIGQPANSGIENNTSLASLDASIEKGKSMNEQQFNESMLNLTEADIAKYLETNGDITDVALLGNNLQDVSLPSQEDYLLDEATLDKYLKEINKTTPDN